MSCLGSWPKRSRCLRTTIPKAPGSPPQAPAERAKNAGIPRRRLPEEPLLLTHQRPKSAQSSRSVKRPPSRVQRAVAAFGVRRSPSERAQTQIDGAMRSPRARARMSARSRPKRVRFQPQRSPEVRSAAMSGSASERLPAVARRIARSIQGAIRTNPIMAANHRPGAALRRSRPRPDTVGVATAPGQSRKRYLEIRSKDGGAKILSAGEAASTPAPFAGGQGGAPPGSGVGLLR
jgi:hypothetical protein